VWFGYIGWETDGSAERGVSSFWASRVMREEDEGIHMTRANDDGDG
jgi:hypothetical protein